VGLRAPTKTGAAPCAPRREHPRFATGFFARCRNAIVATNGVAGLPQLTPNWYLWDGERFLVCTARNTAKVRNLRETRG